MQAADESSVWSTFIEAQLQLLDSMTEAQRDKFAHPWEDTRRLWWTYLPRPRAGLTLGDLGRSQRKLVHRLLGQVLSDRGYAQVAIVMALEDVLDRAEDGRKDRHASDFWIMMFGDRPGGDRWSWRFEGHHVSINVTMVDGNVSVAPCFMGAHPARVGSAECRIAVPFSAEESLAFELMSAMGTQCRRDAQAAAEAPADIYTGNSASCDTAILPMGVINTALDARSAAILDRLVDAYIGRLSQPIASHQTARLLAGPLFFAWEGALVPDQPHYYRIQGRDMIIEYDNSSHNANHVHSVWRRPSADFGSGLLRSHLSEGHDHPHEQHSSQSERGHGQ